VFAHKEHPLALFLDDLQWLDAATLDLLEHLVTHSEVRHLLLLGAYRDNEISPSRPLLRTLEAIRAVDVRVRDIVLARTGPAVGPQQTYPTVQRFSSYYRLNANTAR
jgi:predicted ATPase